MMKKVSLAVVATILSIAAVSTSFAGQWYKDNGKWAYFDDSGNQIKEGWFQDTDGKRYCFNGGVVMSGDKVIDGKHYYFDPTSGEMRTGLVSDGLNMYFYGITGSRQTGWVQVNTKWYYFDQSSGVMVKDQLREINGEKFYFKSDGTMAVSEWVDSKYYAGPDGIVATNQWVDGTYVNSAGRATDRSNKDFDSKKKIASKMMTLSEYMEYVTDALDRYAGYTSEVADGINQWREDYNTEQENKNANNDNDDESKYVEEWDIEGDSEMNKAATLRAVELASCQRASGSRPDGRSVDTIFADLNIYDVSQWCESVAFGFDDGDACYDELKSNSTHTSIWKNTDYTRAGIGVAADAEGRMYCVIMYAK